MPKTQKKFIAIGFDAGREPLDELFWCEAEQDGDWTNVTVCARLRTRREITERISELEGQVVIGVDFPLGFPRGFVEFLIARGTIKTPTNVTKKIREDLKKNTDDGIRKWIDLMGEYRETKTESAEAAQARIASYNKKPLRGRPRELPAHERRTMIERFRRVDRIIRRQFPDNVASTLGIQYNRLTRRYEFVSANARGRTALVGISLLEQIREAKPDVAIWPFEKPKEITIAEVFPKLFEERLNVKPDKLREYFDHEEDNGLHVAKEVRELVYSHDKAREACISVLGMLAAERREDKFLRPLRDYRDTFYSNDEVQSEGWIYGIGFKEPRENFKEEQAPTGEPVLEAEPTVSAE